MVSFYLKYDPVCLSHCSDWTTGWRTEESWFDSRQVQENFFFPEKPKKAVGPTQSPITDTEQLFPRGEAAGS
jgi:hypothetical protein